jgi:hypothetical protein
VKDDKMVAPKAAKLVVRMAVSLVALWVALKVVLWGGYLAVLMVVMLVSVKVGWMEHERVG